MKNPRTYEATKARWNDPASRVRAQERMKEIHRLAKAAKAQETEKKDQAK